MRLGPRRATPRAAFAAACLALLGSAPAAAGSFIFAEGYGVDIITHPPHCTGVGGKPTVSVCVDPAAVDAAAMETPVKNIVAEINGFVPRSRRHERHFPLQPHCRHLVLQPGWPATA